MRVLERLVKTTIASTLFASMCFGSAIVPGFNGTSDGHNDDGTYTTGGCSNDSDGGTCDGTPVSVGFAFNFFGATQSTLYINTNGNVTLDMPLSTFNPFGLANVPVQIIAPFFADVDTRNPDSGVVTFGNGTFNGFNAFGVNWINVGHYQLNVDQTNSFQLLMVNRSDTGAGNFDLIFNYDNVMWESGDASHGENGLGGDSADVGFSNGSGNDGTYFELPGSGVAGSFINNGTYPLIANSLNSNVEGRYIFNFRDGVVAPVTETPEPSTFLLLSGGGIVMLFRKRVFRGLHRS